MSTIKVLKKIIKIVRVEIIFYVASEWEQWIIT